MTDFTAPSESYTNDGDVTQVIRSQGGILGPDSPILETDDKITQETDLDETIYASTDEYVLSGTWDDGTKGSQRLEVELRTHGKDLGLEHSPMGVYLSARSESSTIVPLSVALEKVNTVQSLYERIKSVQRVENDSSVHHVYEVSNPDGGVLHRNPAPTAVPPPASEVPEAVLVESRDQTDVRSEIDLYRYDIFGEVGYTVTFTSFQPEQGAHDVPLLMGVDDG